MPGPLNVAILTFPRCQVLDVTGPAMVFEAGNDALEKAHYKVHILSAEGGTVQTSSAVALVTRPVKELPPGSIDTLLIAGGDDSGLQTLAANESVRKWAVKASKNARRYGSICTGTFALAHFGLLEGKRVATHWSACADLAEKCPDVAIDTNALFVNDGRLWTSAGVTTGIDMSLEMVAADLGNAVAHTIAKRLVLYARRPGYQSQFSPVLNAQSHADAPFAELIHWMRENLSLRLDVPLLAEKVSMSERTFLRRFARSTGETPAHFVETLRLDQTRNLLAAGMSVKDIAARTGYSTGAQLSKAFDRRFGMTPQLFRELHCRSHPV
ncbi:MULTISPECIES: DJ-1/PfpI family protein [unclassified Variovorax]|uniref:GlxA family transcriptional regulator n=1 Tax=unclassified Variovorax TaxID=663243 RepID=UPI00076C8551|nr:MULTISPECIES: DJ-1/PfpI family protein [unclassified Variovorax]KWT74701.1 Transcriptional regulator containing an amidase domain and an AraC-type DNA-binding HTH domain [Variovorax sp. WDL1]PNG53085.1 HTH-type transcriptional regulator CdhR [Variovorax sp. B2]PNG53657.1 HTH-type transcriptional regulator CdhR [Variovorax sp. B4]VTV11094.1 Carnitine catabolism transcriptional activator [Variovorax sp. WDL1]